VKIGMPLNAKVWRKSRKAMNRYAMPINKRYLFFLNGIPKTFPPICIFYQYRSILSAK